MAKVITNVIVEDSCTGEPLTANAKSPGLGDAIPMTVALAARDFAKLVFIARRDKEWNWSDLKAADRVLRAARKAKDTLTLDTSDWEWLTKKIEEHGAYVFGVNTAAVREALDLIEKEKGEEKKG